MFRLANMRTSLDLREVRFDGRFVGRFKYPLMYSSCLNISLASGGRLMSLVRNREKVCRSMYTYSRRESCPHRQGGRRQLQKCHTSLLLQIWLPTGGCLCCHHPTFAREMDWRGMIWERFSRHRCCAWLSAAMMRTGYVLAGRDVSANEEVKQCHGTLTSGSLGALSDRTADRQ